MNSSIQLKNADLLSKPKPDVCVSDSENGGTPAVDDFLKMVAAQIGKTMDSGTAEYDRFGEILRDIEGEIRNQRSLSPAVLPAVRYWNETLKAIGQGPAAELQTDLKTWAPKLRWIQSPEYQSGVCSRDFLDNYACAELVGPNGFCHSSSVIMGIMLLGPDTYYPPHGHPSIECLYVLSGRGTWHLDRGPTISLPPGTTIFIPYDRMHAFWSMDAPLAAIYMCVGEVTTPPRMRLL